jgi:hypothetical protein
MASQPDTNPPAIVRLPDANPFSVRQQDAIAFTVRQPDTNPFSVLLPDATGPIERESLITLSSLSHTTPRAREEAPGDEIQLNGVAIYGPGFKVSYAAIDQAAALIGMPKDRARAIAEICARDWASNKKPPGSPMAVIKRALKSDLNEGQIHDVRMEKARADGKPRKLSKFGVQR